MESREYVVLRRSAREEDPGPGGRPGLVVLGLDGSVQGEAGEKPPLEFQPKRAASAEEFAALERDPDNLSIAPVIPTVLHQPVGPAEAPDADDVTWGVRAVGADTSSCDGTGITVAILDTGIDADHPAFEGVEIEQRDFTGDGDGDENGHGTHCAGTVFGRDVNGRRIGVAPGVTKALIGKVLDKDGRGSTSAITSGIQWAIDQGAHVISMSLGLDFPGLVDHLVKSEGLPLDLATSMALEDYAKNLDLFRPLAELATNRANAEGSATIIIAAAGNESRRDINPTHKIAVGPPAAARGVLSVGALGPGADGWRIAPFSNTGPNLCGPGVGIESAEAGGGTVAMNGTSMAAPHVAGVAALWAQRQLDKNGMIDSFGLNAQVSGKSTDEEVASGQDSRDIGLGMVCAPQN